MEAKENVVNKEESNVGVEDMEGRMINEKNKEGRDRRQCGTNYLWEKEKKNEKKIC